MLKTASEEFPVMLIFPWLMMLVPFTVSAIPLGMLRLSPESIVRFPHNAPTSTVTADDAPFPLSIKTLLIAVGTPALHLLESLQLPVPPNHTSSVCP
jgi:hypothetical protein